MDYIEHFSVECCKTNHNSQSGERKIPSRTNENWSNRPSCQKRGKTRRPSCDWFLKSSVLYCRTENLFVNTFLHLENFTILNYFRFHSMCSRCITFHFSTADVDPTADNLWFNHPVPECSRVFLFCCNRWTTVTAEIGKSCGTANRWGQIVLCFP